MSLTELALLDGRRPLPLGDVIYPTNSGALTPGLKWPGCEADHLQLVPRSRKRGCIQPLRLHGVGLIS
jgi:hypothetical protein